MQEKNTTPVIFSAALVSLMKQRKLTQVKIAAQFGVSQAAVSKWINGSIPDTELAVKIASYFNTTIENMLTGEAVVMSARGQNYSPDSLANSHEKSAAVQKSESETALRKELREVLGDMRKLMKRVEKALGEE